MSQDMYLAEKSGPMADQRSLQAAVNSWRTNVGARTGNPFPVLDNTGCVGTPTTLGGSCNSFVNMAALSDENYLPGTASVKSADPNKNTTATNTPGGSYGWYIDSTGLIRSDPPFVAGRYP